MKKFRVITNMEKEEHYLKEMSEQGWGLVKYSSWNLYTFEKIQPEALSYKIDYQVFKKKAEYIDYLTLFEDSGWKHVGGSRYSGFHFFLPENNKNRELGIFSDVDSSKQRYKRMYHQALMWGTLMIVYLFLFRSSIENISSWYLAPTLWEYTGLQLIGMIAMETFFVVIQLLPMGLFLGFAIYCGVIGIKAKELMKKDEAEE